MTNDILLPIPAPVQFVLDRLEGAGFHAWVVGGCVRDALMGRIPGDYDVTTSALPAEMQEIFSDCRVVETGLKHGTLTVVRQGMNVETTTYRIDGAYNDGRHPDSVTFTDQLSDDLCRRDFTVNAMAYSPQRGLVDLFGGREDLDNCTIRCVGRAADRFSEDGLRILRAMRFSSTLGFTPDEECAEAIHSLKHLLDKISRERIYAELTKLLCGKTASAVLRDFPDVAAHALPPLTEAGVSCAAETIAADEQLPGTPDPALRYALLLDSLTDEEARAAVNSLKPSKDEKNAVLAILDNRNNPVSAEEYAVLRLMSNCGDDFPGKYARFARDTERIDSELMRKVGDTAEKLTREDRPRRLNQLAIGGRDLSVLGITGAALGNALKNLLDAVMRGECQNEKECLLRYVRQTSK